MASGVQVPANNFSLDIVNDLLGTYSEWKETNDIIRLTFKALVEVVNNQGAAIVELQKGGPSPAHIEGLVNSKMDEVMGLVELYTSGNKENVNHATACKPADDLERSFKQVLNTTQDEIDALNTRIDVLHKDLLNAIEQCPRAEEMQMLTQRMATQLTLGDLDEALSDKASKTSVASALHRKANRTDVEDALQTKAEVDEIRVLVNAIEGKADLAHLERILEAVDEKVSREELSRSVIPELQSKLTKDDLDVFRGFMDDLRMNVEKSSLESERSQDEFMKQVRRELDAFATELHAKTDKGELTQLAIARKADSDNFRQIFEIQKAELQDVLALHKQEAMLAVERLEDRLTEDRRLFDGRIAKAESELDRFTSVRKQLDGLAKEHMRASNDYESQLSQAKQEAASVSQEIRTEVLHIKGTVDYFVEQKADKSSLTDLKDVLQRKIDSTYLDQTIQEVQNEITSLIISLKEEVRTRFTGIESNLVTQLEEKVDVSLFETALEEKLDKTALPQQTEHLATGDDVSALRTDVESLRSASAAFKEFNSSALAEIDALRDTLDQKSNTADVCTLIDMKANIDDVNKVFIDLHSEIDGKVSIDQYLQTVEEQGTINEALCAEN